MNGAPRRYGVGILGNCCTHGEFVAVALKAEPQAKIVAGWEADPRRQKGLAEAIGMELAESAEDNLLIHNGRTIAGDDYVGSYQVTSPFQQLMQAIESSTPPDSNAESARLGVEVLMAAYKSTQNGGAAVPLPFDEGANPLVTS